MTTTGTATGETPVETAKSIALAQIPVSTTFVDPLGASITVTIPLDQHLEVKRTFGKRGYVSGEIPPGGLRRPYGEHDRFDWSLLGATPGKDGDDEGVWCRGHFWTKRTYQQQTTGKKMPAAIKYSRGSTPTDPKDIIEKADGSEGKGYVTLIVFRGGGPVNRSYLLPEQRNGNGQQRR